MLYSIKHRPANYIHTNIFDKSITQSVCSFNRKGNHVIVDFSKLDSFVIKITSFLLYKFVWI